MFLPGHLPGSPVALPHVACALAVVALLAVAPAPVRAQQELSLSAEDFARLDTFEGHSLRRADTAFGARHYRQAVAEYDAFLLGFARSAATPYAIYRKGRALQLDHKRFEAIRVFTEVLDYFPDDVRYAAAAGFQIGQAHWDNGSTAAALKAWAEMAGDVEYRLHPFAAGAINRLADALMEQANPVEAVRYYTQVAVDFRDLNGEAARYAISKGIPYYIRTAPDQGKLRVFYDAVRTFDHHPATPSDRNYWMRVIENVRSQGGFAADEPAARAAYFRYWGAQMAGRYADWDDYQIARADFIHHGDGDTPAWIARLDKQFADHQPPDDYARLIKWIQLFAQHATHMETYYAKLDFAKMSDALIQQLMRVCFEHLRDNARATAVFERIRLAELTDDLRYSLARYLWHRDGALVERVCASMEDTDRGRMELLRYWHWIWVHHGQVREAALALADEMTRVPDMAGDAFWMKAEMLQKAKRWSEAIAAFRAAERLPAGPWRIVDCYLADGKRDLALATLREIENFFVNDASQAAWRIALVYRDAGEQVQMAAALRAVLGKYPESRESSAAHLELEKHGLHRIGGGVDAQ